MAKRPPGHLKLVKKKIKVELSPIDHPILRRKVVTSRKQEKYIQSLMAAYAPIILPEVLDALRKNIAATGDTKSAEIILKGFKVLKDGGINVNQNNNVVQAEVVGGFRNFDTFVRERAVSNGMVLDAHIATEEAERAIEAAALPPDDDEPGD